MHGWQVNEENAAAGITAGNSAWQAAQLAMANIDAQARRN